jgi:hypothetical protein
MHAQIRRYFAPPEVLDEARFKLDHLARTMRQTPGLVAYYIVATNDGLASITVTEDETGTTESMGRAARWVQENLQTRGSMGPPEVTTGEILLNMIREDAESLAARYANRAPTGSVSGDGTSECPADYPVKGNADSGIYHMPGSPSYAQTIPEYCFASASDAEAAGFHATG